MKNACAISSLARQLGKVSEKLDSLAEETNADEGGSVFAAGDLTAEKAGDGDGDNGQSEEKK